MGEQLGHEHVGLPGWLTRRRTGLRIGKAEAARRAGVGRMTWHEWEGGKRQPYDSNYTGIEDAMQWTPGSVHAALNGGEPTDLPAEQADELTRARRRQQRIEAFVRSEGYEATPELVEVIDRELSRLESMSRAVHSKKPATRSDRIRGTGESAPTRGVSK